MSSKSRSDLIICASEAKYQKEADLEVKSRLAFPKPAKMRPIAFFVPALKNQKLQKHTNNQKFLKIYLNNYRVLQTKGPKRKY